MFILDGRQAFYQWDLEQKITSSKFKVGDQIHFTNNEQANALVLIAYELNGQVVVDVPNILLQSATPITVYRYIKAADNSHTIEQQDFYVVARAKPDNYIYTETEYHTVEKAVEQALIIAKENGDFKGDKGDKGDAGVIKFIPVTELPEENIDISSIYLLPSMNPEEKNVFLEYVYINGAWEVIGSAGVEVNLDEYVKYTDYATGEKGGIVKVQGYTSGLALLNGGQLQITPATEANIKNRNTGTKPITPGTLDFAVKVGLTTNTLTLTDEEKTAACDWLSAVPRFNGSTGNVYAYVSVGGSNQQTIRRLTETANQGVGNSTIPLRDALGGLKVQETPTDDLHATSKKYVDDAIGDIETGLDSIIAIQENFIGGESV